MIAVAILMIAATILIINFIHGGSIKKLDRIT